VVFVHGFTGDPKDTWTTDGKKGPAVYWPADLASSTVSHSRILTYGYDTNIRHKAKGPVSTKTVSDHAWDLLCSLEALRRNPSERQRPILFVAHSLGGIIVKEALRRSQRCTLTQAHLRGIFEAVVGVLFFGTPHRGADPRNFFHHVLTACGRAFGFQANNRIVNALMPDSERLIELRDEFAAMCHERSWRIFSFQEEYGLGWLFGTKVVDDQSSCLDDPTIETRQHISSNHMDMCRLSSLDDPQYSKVAAAMTLTVGAIEDGVGITQSTPTLAEEKDTTIAGDISPSDAPIPSSTSQLLPERTVKAVLVEPAITNALDLEVGMLPSQITLLFMSRLPDEAHRNVAEVISSNCKATCFSFYQRHALHRSKFSTEEGNYKRKLFQLPDLVGLDCFPQTAGDFSLEEWIGKYVHAWSRRDEQDTLNGSYIYDLTCARHIFKHISKITRVVDAWGRLDVNQVEECLIYSLGLCRSLSHWDSVGRLRALWDAIHRPESPFIDKERLMAPLAAQPRGGNKNPAAEEEQEEGHRPAKRARIAEASGWQGGENDGISETSRRSERSEASDKSKESEADDKSGESEADDKSGESEADDKSGESETGDEREESEAGDES